MADIDDDDGFEDNDLDALRFEDFDQLQQNAISITQHQRPTTIGGGGTDNSSPTVVPYYPDQPSSDYGDLDDEILDTGLLDVPPQSLAQRPTVSPARNRIGEGNSWEERRQQRHSVPLPQRSSQKFKPVPVIDIHNPAAVQPGKAAAENLYDIDSEDDQMLDVPDANTEEQNNLVSKETVDALQAKVAQLLQEREKLRYEAQSANDKVLAKAGEISIVRANQLKASKEHERKIGEIQKAHLEILEQQKAETRNAKKEKERIATENQFLHQDLVEEGARTKFLQRKDRATGVDIGARTGLDGKPPVTPKKNRVLPFRDGFDEEDLALVSPSKAGGRHGVTTPKAGAKRKRKAVENSPSQPLELDQSFGETLPDAPAQQVDGLAPSVGVKIGDLGEQKYMFSRLIINHRWAHDEKRSIELLADFAFPSNPGLALSTLLLDKMAGPTAEHEVEDFPATIGAMVISIWSQCVTEKFYKPLYLLLDLVKFILISGTPTTASHLIDELVVLVQLTADINVIPRYWRSRRLNRRDNESQTEANDDVDTNECLQIMYLMASLRAQNPEDMARFWVQCRFDFISMLLRSSQPIEDVHIMLRLLSTSIREDSFAMIVAPPVDQATFEQHVIDRLSLMLVETPRAAKGERSYDAVEIAEMRSQVLVLIEKVCDKKRGGEAFAKHPFAIGRLVRVMNDELNSLYDWKYGHDHHAELVNQATRILFHLRSTYPNLINMQEKLRVHPGGAYKHLIALTRLTFSESIFYEREIEDDVVECAQLMLEDSVTPEEGDAISEVFSSARK